MSHRIIAWALVMAISFSVMIALTSKDVFNQGLSVNDTQKLSPVHNVSVMMPGGNMTFGSSLENARMHLMEAIMNLNEGDIKGAIKQLNMTQEGIKTHEKEMMEMMKIVKPNMINPPLTVQNGSP